MTQIRWFSCESTEQLVHFSMVTGSCYCLSCQPILEMEMREREGWGRWERKGRDGITDSQQDMCFFLTDLISETRVGPCLDE